MNNYLSNILNTFNITLIDITLDEVLFFKYTGSLDVSEKITYEEYYERCKKSIHPDFINEYFDKISANNLENKEYCVINYLKLSNILSYDNYTDIVKLVDNKILIISFKNEKSEKIIKNNNEISSDITDLIMNIENTLESINKDNYEINNLYNYFSSLVEDIIHKNPDINKNYESKLINKVNKVSSSLLIIDDDSLTRSIFKKAFSSYYNIIEAQNGEEAVEILGKYENSSYDKIVGIFLDLKMPVMDGFGVLDFLKEKRYLSKIPVIIVSADDTKDTKEKVYAYEIADMIEKPFNFEIIVKRVNNMIKMYSKNNSINEIIKSQDKELKELISNYNSSYLIDNEKTFNIASKVISKLLEKYGANSHNDYILKACKYYDIGLKFVPITYFSNINNLNNEAKEKIYAYTYLGSKLLNYIDIDEKIKKYALDIILLHNERYDGKGFPKQKNSKEIPYYVYIANVGYEYANGLIHNIEKEKIVENIKSKSGSKYDPEIITIFLNIIGEI